LSSDESADSGDTSGESAQPEKAKPAPFQFRNRSTATETLPKEDSDSVDVEEDAAAPEVSLELAEPGQLIAPPEPAEGSSGPSRRRVSAPVWLLLVVVVLTTGVAFSSWRSAENDPDRDRANLRDNALIEGTENVETMTSMDHRDVAGGVKAWQSVSTGLLHDQLVSIGKDEQQLLADQGKIATGRVVDAALTELTDRTATLITAVEVTVSEDDKTKEPAVKRNRFTADLVLVSGHWKIENLQQVAVNVS
jgi:Mce-associated membrane protein